MSNLDALDAIHSGWFRAPSNAFGWDRESEMICTICGIGIRPGEIIADLTDNKYVHEYCWDSAHEDQ